MHGRYSHLGVAILPKSVYIICMVIREKAEIMSLGNVNAKLLIEKAVQRYYQAEVDKIKKHGKFHDHFIQSERIVVRRLAAFAMRYDNDMTFTQIAKELGVSYSLVKYDLRYIENYVKLFFTKHMKLNSFGEVMEVCNG